MVRTRARYSLRAAASHEPPPESATSSSDESDSDIPVMAGPRRSGRFPSPKPALKKAEPESVDEAAVQLQVQATRSSLKGASSRRRTFPSPKRDREPHQENALAAGDFIPHARFDDDPVTSVAEALVEAHDDASQTVHVAGLLVELRQAAEPFLHGGKDDIEMDEHEQPASPGSLPDVAGDAPAFAGVVVPQHDLRDLSGSDQIDEEEQNKTDQAVEADQEEGLDVPSSSSWQESPSDFVDGEEHEEEQDEEEEEEEEEEEKEIPAQDFPNDTGDTHDANLPSAAQDRTSTFSLGPLPAPMPSSEMHRQASTRRSNTSQSSGQHQTTPVASDRRRARPRVASNHNLADPDIPLIIVQADGLTVMLRAMGGPKWTGSGPAWITKLSRSGSFQGWLKLHTAGRSPHFKKLFRASYDLMKLFENAPRLFEQNVAAQQAYFASDKVAKKLRMSLSQAQQAIDNVCSPEAPGERKGALESISQRMIPMLLLALSHGFLVSSRELPSEDKTAKDEPADNEPLEDELSEDEDQNGKGSKRRLAKRHLMLQLKEAHFPRGILVHLICIATWIEGLHSFLMQYGQAGDTTNQRRQKLRLWGHLGPNIRRLKACMESSLRKSHDAEDAREINRQLLMEKDYRVKADKETKARALREAQDRRMELFFDSTQGMGRSYSRSVPIPNRRSRQMMTTILPAHTISSAKAGTGKRSSGQVYREQNYGWSWDDDNLLLTIIRRATVPDVQSLRELLPEHNVGEIKSRISDLKAKSRAFYKAKGVAPPAWCEVDARPTKRMKL